MLIFEIDDGNVTMLKGEKKPWNDTHERRKSEKMKPKEKRKTSHV
jgi:hypothetical protein